MKQLLLLLGICTLAIGFVSCGSKDSMKSKDKCCAACHPMDEDCTECGPCSMDQ